MYEDAIIYEKNVRKLKTAQGVVMQSLGHGNHMNVLHWNMEPDSVVPWHSHPQEQFGYVIQGGFTICFEDETFEIAKGDCYFVPPNTNHRFVAIGETEAIDVFNPIKEDIPQEIS